MTEPDRPDSFYANLTGVARSRKGQRLIAIVWPWLLSIATATAGYVGKSMQLEPRLVQIERRLELIGTDVQATRSAMAGFTHTEQQKVFSIGRQAAYATAGFEAYEQPKVKAQKRAWAGKYADAYERMVTREGQSPSVAYTALFRQIDVP